MKSINSKKIKIDKLPDRHGILSFFKQKKCLYLTKTSSIKRKYRILKDKSNTEEILSELFNRADTINWQEYNFLFSALVEEKKALYQQKPEYNRLYKDFKDYVYLSFDFSSVPFLKISENTLKNRYYAGPFHNRFFVYDFLFTMSKLFQYPLCEGKDYPCKLYKEKQCKGYCVSDKQQLTQIFKQDYLTVNAALIKKLTNSYEKYLDELNFKKSELLRKQIKIIKKYYNYIRFFHISKRVNMEFEEDKQFFSLKNGKIKEIKSDSEHYEFPLEEIKYRDNEYLAVNKNQLNEMWIIYNHLSDKFSNRFNKIYTRSVNNFFER